MINSVPKIKKELNKLIIKRLISDLGNPEFKILLNYSSMCGQTLQKTCLSNFLCPFPTPNQEPPGIVRDKIRETLPE